MGDDVPQPSSFPRKRESMFDQVKMGPRWSLPRQVVSRGGDDEFCVIHMLSSETMPSCHAQYFDATVYAMILPSDSYESQTLA